MNPSRRFWCAAPFVGLVLAAVCLVSRTAFAATTADFNGDGIVDSAELSPASPRQIIVRVSGARIQILNLAERVIALVATDVDHDGDADLGVLSEHRGVGIWLNADGTGHFAAHKMRRRPRRLLFQLSSSRSISDRDEGAPRDQCGQDGPTQTIYLTGRYRIRAPCVAGVTLAAFRAHLPQASGSLYSSRAPPVQV